MRKYIYLFNKIGLELPIKPPKALMGGQLHRCFLLVTQRQSYVVKVLNPKVTKQSQFPENYEQSEGVAQMFKTARVNAVAALCFNDHFVQNIDHEYFLIYPYYPGEVLKAANITSQHALVVGHLFAQCHKVGSTLLSMMKPDWHTHHEPDWQNMLQCASEWLDKSLQKSIVKWIESYQKSLSVLQQNSLISHRDLHYGNVIWGPDERAYVVDWESVGIIDPWMEVIGYGLEWAGIIRGKFRPEVFDELIESYTKERGGNCAYPQEAFYGWVGHCLLPWLYFNLERALGWVKHELDAKKRGLETLHGGLLRCLYFLQNNQEDLFKRLNSRNFY